jgi:fructuronate reductase/mannitol 2-dehydrogenase
LSILDPARLLDAVLATPASVSLPSYDRGALRPAVVHIGVGGFHRAHQAMYFDELAELGETGWGVVGVGLRRPQMGEVLRDQFGLFTVVERGPDGDRARIVGSIVRYLFAPDDPAAVLATLAAATTQLVTLTITGAGYHVGTDGALRADEPSVRHDLAHPDAPRTMVGYLVESLRRRREAGLAPFTVLSCDNLPDSGRAARTAVTSFARLLDPTLAEWIEAKVSFPSSMVDRITPETSAEVRDQVESTFALPDQWPVVTEPFRQWVIEDDFCAERPPLERVGVEFVRDVGPHKQLKARVLNGGHSALGYIGALLGHTSSDEAMADPTVRGVLERMLLEEVTPLLPAVPGIDMAEYVETTLQRFANPAVGDALARLCRRGSVKMPSYLLPSLTAAVAEGTQRDMLVLAVAAWMRYLRGTDLSGAAHEIEDPRAESLHALACRGGDNPRLLLGVRSIFGALGDNQAVVAELSAALRSLSQNGRAAFDAAVRSRSLVA